MRATRAHGRNMRPMLIAFDDASLGRLVDTVSAISAFLLLDHQDWTNHDRERERERGESFSAVLCRQGSCIFVQRINNTACFAVNKITSIVANVYDNFIGFPIKLMKM